MRFTPGCNCCGPELGECPLCQSESFQNELDITFWPGEAEESVVTVATPVHLVDATYGSPYGKCTWRYTGVLSDIDGVADDGRGTCTGARRIDVGFVLTYAFTGSSHQWNWQLTVTVQCDPQETNRDEGRLTASDIIYDSVIPKPTYDCDFVGANKLSATTVFGSNTETCSPSGGIPLFPSCLDCDAVGVCSFPAGGVEITSSA